MAMGQALRVEYRGLGSGKARSRFKKAVLRDVISYQLAAGFCVDRLSRMVGQLGLVSGNDPEAALAAAITAHRARLPLAGACPVVCPALASRTITQPLAVLAVVTQSTNVVWLRNREPHLDRISKIREVALWVPRGLAR